MLTLPVACVLVADPQISFLRVLPVPRGWLLGIVAVALAAAHLAWLVLWVRGEGVLQGSVALLAVLGAQSYALAGLRAVRDGDGLAECSSVGVSPRRRRRSRCQTWSQRLRSPSFGQKKRVAVLAALIGNPDLLILDEASNGLDPSGVELMRQLIEERRRAGAMTLLSTTIPSSRAASSRRAIT